MVETMEAGAERVDASQPHRRPQLTAGEFAAKIAANPYIADLRSGNADLRWFKAKPGEGVWGSWGVRAVPSRRGITLMDIERAAGTEPGPEGPSVTAPRGAGYADDIGTSPWEINGKWEVWADNLVTLYEEACSRQWNATADIDWSRLEPLPNDLERALCQYNTFLTMGEYLATDVLAPWLPRFNTYFHEIKLFIASQAMDEARHTEVFRKRIYANGGGMGMAIKLGGALARAGGGMANAASNPLFSSWRDVSFAIHVVFEGAILSMFRFGEFLGKTDVDKQIFRMVMQDEARHVSYGTMHLKFLLDNAPDPESERERLHALADIAEVFFLDLFFLQPGTIESCAILAGDGLDGFAQGLETYKSVYKKMREEYLSRIKRAGLDRSQKCMFPLELPF
ncbi:MAG: ferritin-like domain-containing protein [Actinomycetota bacterium]|nr:ferritin-like domain-containing protein [Actinomycetota bacterium]